jgi:3-phenylpropionate/trans-cinnamate dioxygenase ferredoxin component
VSNRPLFAVTELPVGGLRRFDLDGVPICLAHAADGNFYAFSDTCTHEEQSLSEGELFGMTVECPLHSSLFDLRTGSVNGPPAMLPMKIYPVSIESDEVCIDL